MKIGVNLKIDLTKIDRERIFVGKNGAKYYDMTAFIDTEKKSQYGDNGMITESVTKEERERGVNGTILGNTRMFYQAESNPQAAMGQAPQGNYVQAQPPVNGQPYPPVGNAPAPTQAPQQAPVDFEDDIPFS